MTYILCVDDDECFRNLYHRMLDYIAAVVTQESGRKALEYMNLNNLPALIFSDKDMPDMSGIEFLEVVREKYLYIPAYLVTGDPSTETEQRVQDLRAVMIAKPMDVKVIRGIAEQNFCTISETTPSS
jgi:CheY-like chemotaxis protein